ncbi:hypothetical protein MLD38_026001 [Melastoma candidum]|uniref:Uncharacterized protein n=1 Tax=Melastoma candidum TaxID=119954 RepID=A0ACB9NY64_9MYRT|nr:hypothetical protein MLD38_026001 [Melastoma candidum]
MAITLSNDVVTDNYFPILVCLVAIISFHTILRKFLAHGRSPSLPPSPIALPIIGHLHLIGPVLHICFQDLSLRYGPLMRLCMGASTCVVASNTAVAREIFKTQELNFLSRPEFGSSEFFIYRGSRFIMAPYGDYWRFMKKLCMTRLLAVPQLEKSVDIRAEEVVKLVESVRTSVRDGGAADMSRELTRYTNNVISRMAMSCRCSGSENEADEIKELVKTCLSLAGKLSMGDVLGPWLRKLDFSGNGKKLFSTLVKYDNLIEKIIEEHERKAADGFVPESKKDLMDILLEIFKDPSAEPRISRNDLKSFLLDLFMAGTDTTSTAMQWAMGELINNPMVLQKLRDEIVSTIGSGRLVNEKDVENLPYLRAVIKETMRLHPSAPLIIRECGEDCLVNGYLVKSKTRVLVNVYSVMRDPAEWKDPDEFVPERFLDGSLDGIGEHQMEYKGQNFRYLPFGSGRMGCAGATMAMLVMHAAVGSLVQCFDWRVVGAVDLRQGPGFSPKMATPLVCYPTVRVDPLNKTN